MSTVQKISLALLALIVSFGFITIQKNDHVSVWAEDPGKIYTQKCASCHGEKVEAFVDRQWKHGKKKEDLIKSITKGYTDFGMPAWEEVLPQQDIAAVADLIIESLKTVEQYSFSKEKKKSDGPAVFTSAGMTVTLDTIATGFSSPWGFDQLPDGSFLITDRSGVLYKVDRDGKKSKIAGIPDVVAEGQGGLLDIALHPKYNENGWVYLSYSKLNTEGGKKLTATAVVRGKIKGDQFTESQEIFVALPYTSTRHHYGSRLVFDKKGDLFISVGDRGQEKIFPQDIATQNGKIHRIHDDGRIPKDNPFVGQANAASSVFAYGVRNPQGMTMDPSTGLIWETEHGPRGGDELNIIKSGVNFGWPVITYGINYDGKPISPISKKEGMQQPITYWIPSIAPSGLTFVTGDKYPAWKGSILAGSLRFNYVNRCIIKDNKVVDQEKILLNIGRVRNVEMGKDGYLYVSVEGPGAVYRLKPL
ncbi:MAG: PQQ-dependent sugar dehydrogenase [bacterium]